MALDTLREYDTSKPSPPFWSPTLDLSLLVATLVLLVAEAAVRLSARSGPPSLLLYLGIGAVIGEAGIAFNSAAASKVPEVPSCLDQQSVDHRDG
jgi:hypothetical protein